MLGLNKCFFIGNLTADPELKFSPTGKPITTFTIASNYFSKDSSSGERKDAVEFIRMTAFNRNAEVANDFLSKGSSVFIEARYHSNFYDKDGIRKYTHSHWVERLYVLSRRATVESSDTKTFYGLKPNSLTDTDGEVEPIDPILSGKEK